MAYARILVDAHRKYAGCIHRRKRSLDQLHECVASTHARVAVTNHTRLAGRLKPNHMLKIFIPLASFFPIQMHLGLKGCENEDYNL